MCWDMVAIALVLRKVVKWYATVLPSTVRITEALEAFTVSWVVV